MSHTEWFQTETYLRSVVNSKAILYSGQTVKAMSSQVFLTNPFLVSEADIQRNCCSAVPRPHPDTAERLPPHSPPLVYQERNAAQSFACEFYYKVNY